MNNPQWSTWWTDLRGMAVSAMPRIHKEKPFAVLRARAEINSHFGASAGRADARRRDEGAVGHRRGAATTPIRALRRRAPPGCGPQQNGKVFLREPLASSCLCGEFCA